MGKKTGKKKIKSLTLPELKKEFRRLRSEGHTSSKYYEDVFRHGKTLGLIPQSFTFADDIPDAILAP